MYYLIISCAIAGGCNGHPPFVSKRGALTEAACYAAADKILEAYHVPHSMVVVKCEKR